MKVERILIPIDGSAGGRSACRTGADMAKRYGAEPILLHVNSAPTVVGSMGAMDVPGEVQAVYDEAGARIIREGEQILEQAGLGGEAVTVSGDPAHMILEVAESMHVDVIVMGHRGLSGVERFLLGSVSQKVTHHAECGVFLVPPDESRTDVERDAENTV